MLLCLEALPNVVASRWVLPLRHMHERCFSFTHTFSKKVSVSVVQGFSQVAWLGMYCTLADASQAALAIETALLSSHYLSS